MPRHGPASRNAIAHAVLAYLDRCPAAADDATGVTAFWLPAMGVEAAREDVAAVLAELATQGRIEARPSWTGNTVYSRA